MCRADASNIAHRSCNTSQFTPALLPIERRSFAISSMQRVVGVSNQRRRARVNSTSRPCNRTFRSTLQHFDPLASRACFSTCGNVTLTHVQCVQRGPAQALLCENTILANSLRGTYIMLAHPTNMTAFDSACGLPGDDFVTAPCGQVITHLQVCRTAHAPHFRARVRKWAMSTFGITLHEGSPTV
jgi:hypothetical protein